MFLAALIVLCAWTGIAFTQTPSSAECIPPAAVKAQVELPPSTPLSPAPVSDCAVPQGLFGLFGPGASFSVLTYSSAMSSLGRAPSSIPNYDNVFDRQRSAPRPLSEYLNQTSPTFLPLSFLRGAYGPEPTGPFYLTTQANARADIVIDTAKLAKVPMTSGLPATSFLPALIPARGEAFYGLGERATVFAGEGTGHLGFALNGTTDLTGPFTVYTNLSFAGSSDGQATFQVLHVYGQARNFIFGKTDSAFSDPNVFPDTLDVSGPNTEVYLQHALLAYSPVLYKNGGSSLQGTVSIEFPETNVTPLDNSSNDQKFSNSRSRIPDFAGNLLLSDPSVGHVQAAVILRDVGIENTTFNENLSPSFKPPVNKLHPSDHEDVFGWGVHFTGVLTPFSSFDVLRNDRICAGTIFGDGIASYISDLRAAGAFDALFEPDGELKSVWVFGYWAAYTHFWTPQLSSTFVYSNLHADTFASPSFDATKGQAPYQHGRYAAVNLIYVLHPRVVPNSPAPSPGYAADAKTNVGNLYMGVEYLYGEKELLNKAVGVAHRIELTLGVKF
jgi:hypothetical protein